MGAIVRVSMYGYTCNIGRTHMTIAANCNMNIVMDSFRTVRVRARSIGMITERGPIRVRFEVKQEHLALLDFARYEGFYIQSLNKPPPAPTEV